jgi:hypothetical protein
MIRSLSLAAALALLPLSAALAADPETTSAEARLEAAAEAFEARMEVFGERAEAIEEDESLSAEVKEQRIAALWTEFQPDVGAFTAVAAEIAPLIAAEALASIDLEEVVAEAMSEADIPDVALGVVANSAWTNPDPEQVATYELIADYALSQAGEAEAEAAADEAAAAVAAPASASARRRAD